MVKPSCLFFLLTLWMVGPYRSVTQSIDRPTTGKQYETLRVRFAENLHFTNPFDLETNRVELVIQQPDDSSRILSFFYDGLNTDSVEQWEARFAPAQAGLHRFKVVINGAVKDQFGVPVKVHEAGARGGLMLSGKNGAFEFQDGELFRGIGLNVCWANDYAYYFKKMRDAGLNVTRIWMCPWSLSFEWKETGLGRYNLRTARRLDSILQLAEQYRVYVILCMDYHGVAPKGLGYFRENRWLANPYNKANGGPCASAEDLFTSFDARRFFRQRYKYIVSRFGHSPAIAAWEFMNEADLMAGKSIPVNRWHVEMAEYVKSIDVHRRLVSSSSTREYMEKLVDAFRSPAMDFVLYHDYNSPNLAPHFVDFYEAAVDYYQKPVVLGEFGVEFRGAEWTFRVDSQHVGLHNGIWAGWFSETPIIPLSWWWDDYIDKYDLWREYSSLSRLAQQMKFTNERLEFKTLEAGKLRSDPQEQVPCLVCCILSGDQCALWFKNLDYQWSVLGERNALAEIGGFAQAVPDLVPGRYSVAWYDPQSGQFVGRTTDAVVSSSGELSLAVPAFTKDLACLLTRKP